MRRIGLAVLAMAAVAIVAVAALTVVGLRRFNDITFVDIVGVEPAADGRASNWLLVGTDGREGIDPEAPDAGAFLGEQVVGKRTDTIMVVRVDSAAGTIDLLSIPRDLWLPIAGRDQSGRVNGAYNGEGGRERLVATVEGGLGIDIHHYAEVNFVGFREIVDALDGVPIWFDHPARDPGSGLNIVEPGCHVLDGSQALALARARSYEQLVDGTWQVDPTGDLGRTARQRTFLAAVIDTASTKLGVSQLFTVNEILKVGGRNLIVEDGASVSDMVSAARTFASLGGDRIAGHALPVRDHRTSGGAQVLLLGEGAEAILGVFRDGAAGPAVAAQAAAPDDAGGEVGAEVPAELGFEGSALRSVDPADDGHGHFGFVPSATPAGTPCA